MKNFFVTALTILLVVDYAAGQNSENTGNLIEASYKVWERAPANYLVALQKDNLGVVESAMINIMKLRTVYPEGDYDEICAQLEKLQNNGKTKSIRFMAYITCNYINSPDRFTWLNQNDLVLMDSTLATVNQRLKFLDK
jgi:hypothetical protein